MKLIKSLPRKFINGYWVSMGIFWCDGCVQEVERRLSDGYKCKSCGCNRCKGGRNSFKHGETNTRLYNVWKSMKQRILDSNNKSYKDYGGRGISICSEWAESYILFRDWALNNGYADALVIDRINNNGNYEPTNCRFITVLESNRNKRDLLTLEIANEIRELNKTCNYTQKELSEMYDVSQSTIWQIVNNITWNS